MKKFLFIFCLFLCFPTAAFAQEDEQKRSVPAAEARKKQDDALILTHRSLLDSAVFYKKTDINRSIDYIARSLSEIGRVPSDTERAASYKALGDIHRYHGQLDLAATNYEYALQAAQRLDARIALGQVYLGLGNAQKAEEVFSEGFSTSGTVPYEEILLWEGLGDARTMLGQINPAFDAYQKAYDLATANRITPKQADLSSKLAEYYARTNEPQKAEDLYDSSLKLAEEESPQRGIKQKEKVADYYNQSRNYEEEIQLRKRSLDELEQLPPEAAAGQAVEADAQVTSQAINYKIANAYIEQEKLDEAIPFLEESIEVADREDDLVTQKDATRTLSEVYSKQGVFGKALETYQQYVTVVDTLYLRKEQEIANAQKLASDLLAQQSRITGLERERELSMSQYDLAVTRQKLSEEASIRQQWLIYFLITGLVLTAIAAFFFYRSNKQQRLANNLLALRSLRSQMNPHFIFNALNSVNNFIAKNDERAANKYLSDFSALMRSVLENSEADFIPLEKELQLIDRYMHLEHSRFPEKFEYELEVDPRIAVENFQIPPMLLQPYIENAIWHGLRYKEDKGSLKVSLRPAEEDTISIRIEDDGIGRKRSQELKTEHQKKSTSKGMSTTRERIAILNRMYKDKVDVTLSDLRENGTGTVVVLTLKNEA